jgi:glycosyltransferase involved in cell wall biosynthesis
MEPISVIIPFYNGRQYFVECLRSILEQTVKPAEILVIDDASDTASGELLRQFRPNIKLISLTANGGVANARNVGIENAVGDWTTLMDQDDLWEQRKLEVQAEYVASHPECDAVHTGAITFRADGCGPERQWLDKPGRLTIRDALARNWVLPSSFTVRKAALKAAGGFDRSLCRGEDDYDLIIRLVLSGCKIDFIPQALVRYRMGLHQSSKKLRHAYRHFRVIRKHRAAFHSAFCRGSVVHKYDD